MGVTKKINIKKYQNASIYALTLLTSFLKNDKIIEYI